MKWQKFQWAGGPTDDEREVYVWRPENQELRVFIRMGVHVGELRSQYYLCSYRMGLAPREGHRLGLVINVAPTIAGPLKTLRAAKAAWLLIGESSETV
jgi:hypothetical protein